MKPPVLCVENTVLHGNPALRMAYRKRKPTELDYFCAQAVVAEPMDQHKILLTHGQKLHLRYFNEVTGKKEKSNLIHLRASNTDSKLI